MIIPDVHIELWNAFNDISFNEPDHKYTDSKGTVYQSATGWIKQFEADTDWDGIKKRKAEKETPIRPNRSLNFAPPCYQQIFSYYLP